MSSNPFEPDAPSASSSRLPANPFEDDDHNLDSNLGCRLSDNGAYDPANGEFKKCFQSAKRKTLESLDPESSISCRSTYIHGEIPLDTLVDIFVESPVETPVGTLIETLVETPVDSISYSPTHSLM